MTYHSSYHEITIPKHCIALHCISGIFIPLHISSQGTYPHNIAYLRSLSHCIVTTYQGISILLSILRSRLALEFRCLLPSADQGGRLNPMPVTFSRSRRAFESDACYLQQIQVGA